MNMSNTQNLLVIATMAAFGAASWWLADAGVLSAAHSGLAGVDPVLFGFAGAVAGILVGWISVAISSAASNSVADPEPATVAELASPGADVVEGPEQATTEPPTHPTPDDVGAGVEAATRRAESMFDAMPEVDDDDGGYQPSLNSVVVALSDVKKPGRAEQTTDDMEADSTPADDNGPVDVAPETPEAPQEAEGESDAPSQTPDKPTPDDDRPINKVASISPFGGGESPGEPGEFSVEGEIAELSVDALTSSFGSELESSPETARESAVSAAGDVQRERARTGIDGVFDGSEQAAGEGLDEHTASYSDTATMAVPNPGVTRSEDDGSTDTFLASNEDRRGRLRAPRKSFMNSRMGIVGDDARKNGGSEPAPASKRSEHRATQTRRVGRDQLDRMRRSAVANSETEIQRLYRQFIDEVGGRKAANSVMDYQRFQTLVRKNRQKVREKYSVESLEMSVRVEAGRPKITIRPAS